MNNVEAHIIENLRQYIPAMWHTVHPTIYCARTIPNGTVNFRGQWLRPLNLDEVTP